MINKQILEALKELQEAINRQTKIINELWSTKEHRCPTCHKLITDWEEWEFVNEMGECGTCDHVRSDLVYEPREREEE